MILLKYLLIIDLEVDIETVHNTSFKAAHQVLHHGCVVVSFARGVIDSFFAHLDASRVERCVLVLVGGDEDYVFEMLQA